MRVRYKICVFIRSPDLLNISSDHLVIIVRYFLLIGWPHSLKVMASKWHRLLSLSRQTVSLLAYFRSSADVLGATKCYTMSKSSVNVYGWTSCNDV